MLKLIDRNRSEALEHQASYVRSLKKKNILISKTSNHQGGNTVNFHNKIGGQFPFNWIHSWAAWNL